MSTTRWYYVDNGERQGPVRLDELVELILGQQLTAETLVWRHGLPEWRPAIDMPEIAKQLPQPVPPGRGEEPGLSPPAAPPPESSPVAAPEPASQPEPLAEENPFVRQLREQLATNSRVFAQLAEELRKDGQLDEAIQICREGMREHPKYLHARITLGRALAERGELEEARYELQTALGALPQSAFARRALAECLEQMGDLDGARAQYTAALALAPDNEAIAERLQALERASLESRAPASIAGDPQSEPLLDLPEAFHRPPDEDLPPIPLVPADEGFELETPYDVQSVWRERQAAPASAPAAAAEIRTDGRALSPLAPLSKPPAGKLTGGAPLHTEVSERLDAAATRAPVAAGRTSAGRPPGRAGRAAAGRKAVVWPARRLAEDSVPDLIEALHTRRWTGVLALGRMGIEKTIRFRDGRLEFATSSDPDERLGELLLKRGRITVAQYLEARTLLGKGRRLGSILVKLAALKPEELVAAVVDHAREIIYGAFQWTDGLYQLRENVERGPEDITLSLSTPEVILQGISRIDRWSRVQRGVGGLESLYALADGYEAHLRPLTLSPERREILERGATARDVATICRESRLPDFEVFKTLWAFRVIGIMQRLPPSIPGPSRAQ